MATPKMDEVYPKRKNPTIGGKVSKAQPRDTKKSRETMAGMFEDASTVRGSVGGASAQPASLLSARRTDEHDDVEEILRQFDMNMAYGPCLGMTRLDRWERAQRIGLNPPQDVKDLLEILGSKSTCLWDGRV